MRLELTINPGELFHNWQVIKETARKGKLRYFLCECVCGIQKSIQLGNLRNGSSKSCGCEYNHGMSGTVEHGTWLRIKSRCCNENDQKFYRYGGRGIKVCNEWLNSFESFFMDMGNRPKDCTSIDRIDNNKGYFKENCRWADDKTQARNKSNTKLNTEIVAKMRNGELTTRQVADLTGCAVGTARQAKRSITWREN